MKVDTGLVILDDSGSDLMKKHSFQSNFNVTTFCDKTLQNTAFWDRVSGKRPETNKQVTILSMMKVDTGLVVLDDCGSDLMKNHSFLPLTLKVSFLLLSSQNGLFWSRISEETAKVREKSTLLCMMKLLIQLVILNDSGSDLMKKH